MLGRTRRKAQLSVLDVSCDFVGNLTYSGTLEILGRVEGYVGVEGNVVLGPSGLLVGNLKADIVEIQGKVIGQVDTSVLKLSATGKLIGDATYDKILMEEGAVYKRIGSDGTEATVIFEGQEEKVLEKEIEEAVLDPKEERAKKEKPKFQTVF